MSQSIIWTGKYPMIGKTATISKCGKYRYTLGRYWDYDLPTLVWVMLNPSTADSVKDDPTIKKCMAFSRAWGYGGLVVVNLYAFRATKPADLWKAKDPVGPSNNKWITRAAFSMDVLAAWGNNAKDQREQEVNTILATASEIQCIKCLGMTKQKKPKHPLFIAGNTTPVQFDL